MKRVNNILRFNILSILQLALCHGGAQDASQNYIHIHDYSAKQESIEYFDGLGRIVQKSTRGMSPNEKVITMTTEYDMMGREAKTWLPVPVDKELNFSYIQDFQTKSNKFYEDYYAYREHKYDLLGRLASVSTPGQTWHNASKVKQTEYITNLPNSVKKIFNFHQICVCAEWLLSRGYTYRNKSHGRRRAYPRDIQGCVGNSGKNIFTEELYYADADYDKCYNGNISEARWIFGNDSIYNGYRYRYDGMNRLVSANSVLGNRASENEAEVCSGRYDLSLTYYDNSAIKSLVRKGLNSKSNEYSIIDNMMFLYNNDFGRLSAIKDYAQKVIYDGAFDFIDDTVQENIEYLGYMIYENNSKILYNFGNGLAFASTSYPTFSYSFFYKDHLGNNCAVTTSSGHILQANHYYPDGVIQGSSTNQGYQRYKYNGKELDRMYGLNWYDYGARQYDPTIGQFTTIDPLCEKYYYISPYAYCAGNPVNAVDPNGMDWYQNNETGYYFWFPGNQGHKGYKYIGQQGALLGEYENKINNILIKQFNTSGLYTQGRSIEITDVNKGAIMPANIFKMNDFLDEFLYGYGPEISILKDNHPYTKAIEDQSDVQKAQHKILEHQTVVPGQITGYRSKWGLGDVFTTFSMAKQFIGSFCYDGYTSKNGKRILNIVYDSKSAYSWLYHITKKLDHSRQSKIPLLSTTYQFYIWQSSK